MALASLAVALLILSAVLIIKSCEFKPDPILTPPSETPDGSASIVTDAPPPEPVTPSNNTNPFTTAPVPANLGTSNLYLEYILDASGSMNKALPDGSLKLEVARELLSNHLQAFHPETNIGLRAYGHRVDEEQVEQSCQDIELIAPVQKGQLETIVTWLGHFQAQGMTPLAESIRLAMQDFILDPGRINSIVMISDGQETCGGDPCGFVQELRAQGVNFAIHVIGLNVDEPTGKQLLCIADASGGTYYNAQSRGELKAALDIIQNEVLPAAVTTPSVNITPQNTDPGDSPKSDPAPTPSPQEGEAISPTDTDVSTPTPIPTESSLKIAFFSDDDTPGSGEIYLINPDGSEQIRLTSSLQVSSLMPGNPPEVSGFGWSPVTSQFIYDAFGKMYTANSAQNAQNLLAEQVQYSALSPDGQRIAFVDLGSDPDRPAQVSVLNVDGSGHTQLTKNDDSNTWFFYPTWSPDGQRVAYKHSIDGVYNVSAVDAGGGVPELLITSDVLPRLEACRWSPNGQYMACDTIESTRSIYLVELSTNRATKLISGAAWPTWSPDGNQIAFQQEGDWQIWVINVDGSEARQLTTNGRNCCPIWVSFP